MQKLLTIYLDNASYGKGKMLVTSYADHHGLVEQHLQNALDQGWVIKSLSALGGNSDGLTVRGWVVVLLEMTTA